MKKILVSLMLVFALTFSICVAEEMSSFNLEEMSLEELLNLDMAIQEEIYNRDQFNEIVLFPGKYVIGQDLNAGTYIVICQHLERENRSGELYRFDNEKKSNVIEYFYPHQVGDAYQIVLKDGEMITIDRMYCTMIKRK